MVRDQAERCGGAGRESRGVLRSERTLPAGCQIGQTQIELDQAKGGEDRQGQDSAPLSSTHQTVKGRPIEAQHGEVDPDRQKGHGTSRYAKKADEMEREAGRQYERGERILTLPIIMVLYT